MSSETYLVIDAETGTVLTASTCYVINSKNLTGDDFTDREIALLAERVGVKVLPVAADELTRKAERIALRLVLSEYDDTLPVDQVIDLMIEGVIVPCEQFDDWNIESVVNHIKELAEAIEEGMK
jgi:hypothetical protein